MEKSASELASQPVCIGLMYGNDILEYMYEKKMLTWITEWARACVCVCVRANFVYVYNGKLSIDGISATIEMLG